MIDSEVKKFESFKETKLGLVENIKSDVYFIINGERKTGINLYTNQQNGIVPNNPTTSAGRCPSE